MKNRIPDGVLKEIFPKKHKQSFAPEWVYSELKQMILSGKFRKGQKLLQDKIAKTFNVNKLAVSIAFSRLRKDGLVIIKNRVGTFVV
jgi:DNA-binding GntR family transcriptional regulator